MSTIERDEARARVLIDLRDQLAKAEGQRDALRDAAQNFLDAEAPHDITKWLVRMREALAATEPADGEGEG